MASADWMKMTMPHAAGGMKVHLGTEERATYDHSNPDIDKSKSYQNITIGYDDYKDALVAMKARVEEVDAQYPPKRKVAANERVVAEMIEVKCPQEIAAKGYDVACEYFKGLYKVLGDYFGTENVHGGMVHFDEIHEYTDKDGTKKESLPHMHTLVSAYCEWTEKDKKTGEVIERRGINGKNFEKRPRYNELNKAIDDYCMENYGVRYTKGKGKSNGKAQNPDFGQSVEELKAAENLHQLTGEIREKQAQILALEPPPKGIMESKAAYEKRVQQWQHDVTVGQIQAEVDSKQQEIAEKSAKLEHEKAQFSELVQTKAEEIAKRKVKVTKSEKRANLRAFQRSGAMIHSLTGDIPVNQRESERIREMEMRGISPEILERRNAIEEQLEKNSRSGKKIERVGE